MHRPCEEVLKLLEDYELNIMVRAQQEGIDPEDVKTLYHLSTAKNPVQEITICLERFGYDRPQPGRPNLCPGTPCLDEGAEYVQLWNEKKDAMFLLKNEKERESSFGIMGGIPAMMVVEKNSLSLYYVGPEKYLDGLDVLHEPVDCPNGGKGCDQYMKVYRVADVTEALFKKIGKEKLKVAEKIFKEEAVKIAAKKNAFCDAKCGRGR